MAKRVKENSGLVVEDGKEKARRDSSARSTLSYAQHRRSRSASEKSLNLPRVGGSYCKRKDLNESADLVPSTSSCRATPLHKNSYSKKDDISNHRVSLEQDIEQLHLRLQQEKSMRVVLEKAIGRASSTLSPGHRHFAAQLTVLFRTGLRLVPGPSRPSSGLVPFVTVGRAYANRS
ncbi:UNVERIFIED_CONTAM: hypothetical protein Sradi_1870600 [Sesamum radiatum]|uniref:Ternary complex factor MIP1 leucine-zipper domain-containing protein n=1 Tax=Sesamum radiatum TaxID=300843 RepID=A0AAW2TXL0_SESRA